MLFKFRLFLIYTVLQKKYQERKKKSKDVKAEPEVSPIPSECDDVVDNKGNVKRKSCFVKIT